MNKPTHALGGLLAGVLVTHVAPLALSSLPAEVVTGAGLVLALAGGLAPDRIQYTIKSVRWPLEGHRGVSHTLLFLIVTSLLFRPEFALYWGAGLLSHLILDVITVAGIPLWWPVHLRRVSLSITTNGGAFEFVLRVLLLLALSVLLVAPLARF